MSRPHHEIGSDIPPRAAEVEPPAIPVFHAGGSAEPELGVTANAIILLGYLVGGLFRAPYSVVSINPDAGAIVLQHELTLNTFRVAVVQLEGTEWSSEA